MKHHTHSHCSSASDRNQDRDWWREVADKVIPTNLLYSCGWKQEVRGKAAVKHDTMLPESSGRIEFYIVSFKGVMRNIDCWHLGGTGRGSVHWIHTFCFQCQTSRTSITAAQTIFVFAEPVVLSLAIPRFRNRKKKKQGWAYVVEYQILSINSPHPAKIWISCLRTLLLKVVRIGGNFLKDCKNWTVLKPVPFQECQ